MSGSSSRGARRALRPPLRAAARRAGGLLPLLPAAWILWLIRSAFVDLPIHDQHLTLLPFLEKVATGQAGLGDYFAPDGVAGSHVIALPKALFAMLAMASDWNIRWELYAGFALALLTCFLLIRLPAKHGGGTSPPAADLLTGLLVFSLVQSWNWLWGYALMYFLVNALVVAGVFLLATDDAKGLRVRVAGAIAIAGLATFTMAQGALMWIGLAPSLLHLAIATSRKRALIGAWLASGALFVGLLVLRIPRQTQVASIVDQLGENPLPVASFILRCLGIHFVYAVDLLPLAPSTALGLIVAAGLVALTTFLCASGYLLARGDRRLRPEVVAWISLGLFSIGYAGALAVGRWRGESLATSVFWPLRQVISMYSTTLVLFPIAVLRLSALALQVHANRSPGRRMATVWPWAFSIALASLLGFNFAVGAISVDRARGSAATRGDCIALARYLAPRSNCGISPSDPKAVDAVYSTLSRLGFRDSVRNLGFERRPADRLGSIVGHRSEPRVVFDFTPRETGIAEPTDRVVVSGTLTRDGIRVDARSVLLSTPLHQRFFAIGGIGEDGTWEVEFSGALLGGGRELPVFAWIYDAPNQVVRRLGGSLRLVREGDAVRSASVDTSD